MSMNVKYRLFVRRGGMFYAEDIESRKQTSLGTKKPSASYTLRTKRTAPPA